MLAIVEPPGLEWVQALEWVPWLLGYLVLFAAVVIYPWPVGVRCRALRWGAGLVLLNQVVLMCFRLGVLGTPRYLYEEEIPGWRGVMDVSLFMVLGLVGGMFLILGAWSTTRDLVRTWSRETPRKGGRGA